RGAKDKGRGINRHRCARQERSRKPGRASQRLRGRTCIRASSPSVSGLVIVLTLQMRRKEGHPAYRPQGEPPPGRGTTLGGSTEDPRRQRTRTAAARDTTRAGGGQRQRGVPRAGD